MPEHAQKYPLDARKIDARPFPTRERYQKFEDVLRAKCLYGKQNTEMDQN